MSKRMLTTNQQEGLCHRFAFARVIKHHMDLTHTTLIENITLVNFILPRLKILIWDRLVLFTYQSVKKVDVIKIILTSQYERLAL